MAGILRLTISKGVQIPGVERLEQNIAFFRSLDEKKNKPAPSAADDIVRASVRACERTRVRACNRLSGVVVVVVVVVAVAVAVAVAVVVVVVVVFVASSSVVAKDERPCCCGHDVAWPLLFVLACWLLAWSARACVGMCVLRACVCVRVRACACVCARVRVCLVRVLRGVLNLPPAAEQHHQRKQSPRAARQGVQELRAPDAAPQPCQVLQLRRGSVHPSRAPLLHVGAQRCTCGCQRQGEPGLGRCGK